jgi:probable rRNA maturation factor
MIIFDPDLESDQSAKMVKRSAARIPRANPRDNRVPSARTLARFLREAQDAVKLRGQVTVLLTTDSAMRRLNRQFRGKNQATDVLSFPAAQPSQVSKARPGAPIDEEIAGDIAISVDTTRKQAAGLGHTLAVEIKVLVLHGLLHLAGYDHETDDGEMARLEERLRAKLRLPQGLIERAETAGSRSLSFPTHSAIKLRNGWGTQRSYKAGKERRA